MRIVVAPDSFKGAADARQAADAMARGVRDARPDAQVIAVPMADGGEGTLEVLLAAEYGARRRTAAHGPLGEPIDAPVGLIRRASTAVIELAAVCGYSMVPPDRRDPLKTTTYGLGEVLRAAMETEVEQVILAVGGSATVDGGAGMMQALGLALYDAAGRELPRFAAGGDLPRIARVAWRNRPANLDAVHVAVAADVLNPACGPNGAARVFAPQKGADAAAVEQLDRGIAGWADLLEANCGSPKSSRRGDRRIRDEPGAGAAGAVALPLMALANASIAPGVDLVIEATRLAEHIADADLVLTGEGRLDRQSMMGKVVGAVGRLCRAAGVPCTAIVGAAGDGADECLSVIDRYITLDGPIDQTAKRLQRAAASIAAAGA